MTDYLFDTPWWLPAVVAAVGVALFVSGNRRQEARVRAAGAAAVLLAVALAALSYFVDTDKEKAEKGSRALVDAFERRDWPAMERLLHPSAGISVQGAGDTGYNDRGGILDGARKAQDLYDFEWVHVTGMEVDQRGPSAVTVTLDVLSQTKTLGRPMRSTWQFEWQPSGDGWVIHEVRALKLEGMKPEDIRRVLPAVRKKVQDLLKGGADAGSE